MHQGLVLAALTTVLCGGAGGQPAAMRIPAPEFRDVTEWINSPPFKLADLKGQVVVVHFWAFG